MIHKPESTPCPFCQPASSSILTEDALTYAIDDSFPVNPGHTLIIPKRHVASWFDATDEERLSISELLDTVKEHLDKQTPCPSGYNIGINIGEAAGQTVMHLHVHVIPRYKGDQEDPRGGVRLIFPDKARYWE